MLLSACVTIYPMRRTYGSCDVMLDRLNFLGGPFLVVLFGFLFFLCVRAIANKK